MVRPDLPPPEAAVGAFDPEKLRTLRRLPNPNPKKGEDGKVKEEDKSLSYPAWFTRTGIRSFEVDTGMGIVKCCTPDSREARLLDDAKQAVETAREKWNETRDKDENGGRTGSGSEAARKALDEVEEAFQKATLRFTMKMLRELPEGWVNEGDEVQVGKGKVLHNDPLPAPLTVPPDHDSLLAYLGLLPPSLLPQVSEGWTWMSPTPLHYDESRNPNPS